MIARGTFKEQLGRWRSLAEKMHVASGGLYHRGSLAREMAEVYPVLKWTGTVNKKEIDK
jgi:hypothetical protein